MTDLTVVSLFDGIGGFLLAFQRAGARLVASVEIDEKAAAVSHRHFPDVAQFDDVTKVTGDDLRAVGFVSERGVVTAGWPCQDLSIAGRRAGLEGARSGLWWEVVRILDETRSCWFLGENVPGLLSSNNGEDMGAVVGALGELGYGVAYRVLDAQFFGVPQRRRRVFFVGHLGVPFTAAAEVLFECESGGGDSASGGEAGSGVTAAASVGAGDACSVFHTHTHTLTASASKMVAEDGTGRGCPIVTTSTDTHTQRCRRCRPESTRESTRSQRRAGISSSAVAALTSNGVGTCGADDNQAQAGHLIAYAPDVAPTLLGGSDNPASHGKQNGSDRGALVVQATTILGGGVTHTLTNDGFDASEDGTGRGTPIVVHPLALRGREGGAELEIGTEGGPQGSLRSAGGGGGGSLHSLVSITSSDTPVSVAENQRGEIQEGETVGAVTLGGGKPGQGYPAVREGTVVRRLTELECERLQGYPDNWTEGQTGSARYRQLGNSVAVPVVEWIAHRLVNTHNQKGDQ